MKYKDWLTDWLELYVRPSVKKRTYERYSELARTIKSTLGEYELNELLPLILQKAITQMLTSGNSKTVGGFAASKVNSVILVMQCSLKTAHNLGFMDNYIGDKIKRPKPEEKRIECFTITEQKRIEQAVFCRFYLIVTVITVSSLVFPLIVIVISVPLLGFPLRGLSTKLIDEGIIMFLQY